MARLYANENFPFPVVESLRQLGHDVVTIQETGRAGEALPDPEVLLFAIQDRRAVLTLNRRHFMTLHLRSPEHFGIIVCTVDSDFAGQASRIDFAIRVHASLECQLIRVNRPS